MNAEDRNVSGSSRNMLRPMMVSRCRTSMPIVLDSALKTVPSSIATDDQDSEADRPRRVVPPPPSSRAAR